MELNLFGKPYKSDVRSSKGAPVYAGVPELQIKSYFQQLARIETMPVVRNLAGKGELYAVEVANGPYQGMTVNLRRFSESAEKADIKWTIDIKNNPFFSKRDSIEIKFN